MPVDRRFFVSCVVVDCGAFGDGEAGIFEGTEAGAFEAFNGSEGVASLPVSLATAFTGLPRLSDLSQPDIRHIHKHTDIIFFISIL
jgi:hypothetical protein